MYEELVAGQKITVVIRAPGNNKWFVQRGIFEKIEKCKLHMRPTGVTKGYSPLDTIAMAAINEIRVADEDPNVFDLHSGSRCTVMYLRCMESNSCERCPELQEYLDGIQR